MWIKNLLIDIELFLKFCIIYVDNQAALKIKASNGNHNHTKHMSLKYHYVKDLSTTIKG